MTNSSPQRRKGKAKGREESDAAQLRARRFIIPTKAEILSIKIARQLLQKTIPAMLSPLRPFAFPLRLCGEALSYSSP
jgi:hypothetical protein